MRNVRSRLVRLGLLHSHVDASLGFVFGVRLRVQGGWGTGGLSYGLGLGVAGLDWDFGGLGLLAWLRCRLDWRRDA